MKQVGMTYARPTKPEPQDAIVVPVNFRMSRAIYRAFKAQCIADEVEVGRTMAWLVERYVLEGRR